MARKSAASLSIVPGGAPRTAPAPPRDLVKAEKALWRDIVESKPVDWFGPDSIPILKEYVRAAVACDLLARLVHAALASGDADIIKAQMDRRDKEARRAASLATKLRLTQQSRYGARSADRADQRAGGHRPWQTGT